MSLTAKNFNTVKFIRSVTFAVRGITESIKTGRNLRIQMVCGAYVLMGAPFFLKSRGEWIALILTVGAVWTGEIFNTALERLTDHSVHGYAPLARAAKDAAAGAVLVASLIALAVAAILFIRVDGILAFWDFCRAQFWYPAGLVLLLIPSMIFIFRK